MIRSAFLEFDSVRCERCGRCVDDCLTQALVKRSDGSPTSAPDFEARCFRCQHCFSVCPVGAIRLFGNDPLDSEPLAPTPSPDLELALFRKRRSVRSYIREDVDPEIVDQLHYATSFAPTGCNDRRLYFSYSDSLASTDDFREAARLTALRLVKNAGSLPERLAFLSGLREKLEMGKDVFFCGAPCFVAVAVAPDARDANVDPFIAAAHFELLANCFGLGTCWCGMATELFLYDDNLRSHLNLPKDRELKTIMTFGWPAVQYVRSAQPSAYPRTRVVPFGIVETAPFDLIGAN